MKRDSFTLVELVVAMVLVSIISVGVGWFMYHVAENFKIVAYRQDIAMQGKLALDMVTQELREVDKDEDGVLLLTAADTSQVGFTHVDGTGITYQLSGNDLLRNGVVLCEKVSDFSLTYWDDGHNQLSTPVNAADRQLVQNVVVELTLDDRGQVMQMESQATLRNVRTR